MQIEFIAESVQSLPDIPRGPLARLEGPLKTFTGRVCADRLLRRKEGEGGENGSFMALRAITVRELQSTPEKRGAALKGYIYYVEAGEDGVIFGPSGTVSAGQETLELPNIFEEIYSFREGDKIGPDIVHEHGTDCSVNWNPPPGVTQPEWDEYTERVLLPGISVKVIPDLTSLFRDA